MQRNEGSGRPQPLVPADVDLRDFPYTPIIRARLFGSTFHAETNDSEWRAGMTLWLKAWEQAPAGTLPTDDVNLCRLAELGRDLKTWRKLKAKALHGWFEAVDGRLYHRVCAQVVLEAWIEKLGQQISGGAGNAKRHGIEFDAEPLKRAVATSLRLLFDLDPQSRTLRKKRLPFLPTGTKHDPDGPPDGNPGGSKTEPLKSPDGLAREVKLSEVKRSEGNLSNRDVSVLPAAAREDPPGEAPTNGNLAAQELQGQRQNAQQWDDPGYVEASAKTFGMEQRRGEQEADFRDRVYSEAQRRRVQAAQRAA